MRVHPLDMAHVEAFTRRAPFAPTHLERVVYPEHGERGALLKAHLLDYWLRVADHALPFLGGRPLVLRRYPRGVTESFFYTKDWTDRDLPRGVKRVPVWSATRNAPMEYAVTENADALAWLVQKGAVEAHAWLSRLGADPARCATETGLATPACGLDHPDVLAFDVDPYVRAGRTGVKGSEAGGDPGVDAEDWQHAVDVALALRDVLDALGLPAFAKTSGKRGVHVLVPLVPHLPFHDVRAVARTVAEHAARRDPERVTVSYAFAERKGRVFLDYNQNVRGKTLAAPLSPRPTPEATVSMPVQWRDLPDVDPRAFTVTTVPDLLRDWHDPWAEFRNVAVDLPRELAALEG